MPPAASCVLCFSAAILLISACSGAVVGKQVVLPTEMCGSKYEVANQSSYLCADIKWDITDGFVKEILRNLGF